MHIKLSVFDLTFCCGSEFLSYQIILNYVGKGGPSVYATGDPKEGQV